MTELSVTIQHGDDITERRLIQVSRIANLGMASRDPPDDEELEAQIDQMKESGVKTQDELPFVVPKPNNLITTDDHIQVNTPDTAGEAEFVLFPTEEAVYLGVGNDHKDYHLAPSAMHRGNSTCPSVVSDELWVLDDVRDHWDELELRSWVETDGSLEAYQRASLEAFMRPDALLKQIDRKTTKPLLGTSIWSGTIGQGSVDAFPTVVSGDFYAVQLYDPVLDRRLHTHYEVRLNDWIRDVNLCDDLGEGG